MIGKHSGRLAIYGRTLCTIPAFGVRLILCCLLLSHAVTALPGPQEETPTSNNPALSAPIPSLAEVSRAIALATGYLEHACGPDGRFAYKVDVRSGRESSSYDIIRHAGAMYALAMVNRSHPDPEAAAALIRAAKFLRENYIGPGPRPGHQVVWSQPVVELSKDQPPKPRERHAELGGTGLGLVALAAAREVDPNSVPLDQLQALGRFALFLQRDDGSFVHKYRAESGPVPNWESLYYPGEAALGFIALYEADHSREWLMAAGKGLSYLAKSRAGLATVPADHWALIATAKLLPYCEDRGCGVSQEELVRHAVQVCESILRDQFKGSAAVALDGAFDSTGGTAAAATRLEGLLAALEFVPKGELRDRIEAASGRGIAFLLRAQVVSGREEGGMPGSTLTRVLDSAQIRIDYVQHALCAWLRYQLSTEPGLPGSKDAKTDSPVSNPTRVPIATSLASELELLHTHYRFENDGTGVKEVIARIRILTWAGALQWSELSFDYKPSKESIQVQYVRISKKGGKVIKVDTDQAARPGGIFREGGLPGLDYNERRVGIPSVSPGDAIEYDVQTIFRIALTPGQFWEAYSFDSVPDEELEIDVPSARVVKVKTKVSVGTSVTEQNGRRIYRWKCSRATSRDGDPDVQISSFVTWVEVGRWYADMEKTRRVPSPEVRAKAETLTRGLTSNLDKVEALYDFTAKNIKYLSLVSVGIGGYEPHAANEVLESGYGDCKDKDALLAALLEAEGMHASSVLINTFRELDVEVPSPWPFTHVITMVQLGKDEVWMDTSNQMLPFRTLPNWLHQKRGLVIPTDGAPHFEEVRSIAFLPDT
jgi:Domain of Unknown Function with PDB structure (DUF3857)/Transglutaminase-like superfamily